MESKEHAGTIVFDAWHATQDPNLLDKIDTYILVRAMELGLGVTIGVEFLYSEDNRYRILLGPGKPEFVRVTWRWEDPAWSGSENSRSECSVESGFSA